MLSAGSRVLLTKSPTSFMLGTIFSVVADHSIVSLDSRPFAANTFVKVPNSLLVEVDYFRLQNSRTKYDAINHTDVDVHKLLLSKKNTKFDLAAVRSGWCWTNANLFDYALHKVPTLVDTAPIPKNIKAKKLLGLFTGSNPPQLMVHLKSMISMYATFTTTVHEMIHQYQWEHNTSPATDGNLGHGPDFMKWAEAVKSTCKVVLNVRGDYADNDVEFTKDDLNTGLKQDFYVLMMLQKEQYWAVCSNNLHVLEQARDVYSVRYTTYLRKMRNEKIRTTVPFVTTFGGKIRNWTQIQPKLAELILDEGTAVYAKHFHKECC